MAAGQFCLLFIDAQGYDTSVTSSGWTFLGQGGAIFAYSKLLTSTDISSGVTVSTPIDDTGYGAAVSYTGSNAVQVDNVGGGTTSASAAATYSLDWAVAAVDYASSPTGPATTQRNSIYIYLFDSNGTVAAGTQTENAPGVNGVFLVTINDVVGPETPTIDAPTAGLIFSGLQTIAFTATYNTANGVNAEAYQLIVDGQYWNGSSLQSGSTYVSDSVAPGAQFTVDVPGLAAGSHTWSIATQESSTNQWSSAASGSFTIATAPNAPTDSGPSTLTAGNTATLTGTYSSTDGANMNAYALAWYTNGTLTGYWQDSSGTFGASETWNTTANGTTVNVANNQSWNVVIPASLMTSGNTYGWAFASREADANMEGPFAATQTFTVSSAYSAPAAPTLVAPGNGTYEDVSGGLEFKGTYNSTDGTSQSAFAYRIKLSGTSTYQYWNGTGLQSTQVQVTDVVPNGGTISFTLPASTFFANGNSFNWSMASWESGASPTLGGPYATDYTLNAQTAPTMTFTGPNGTVLVSQPEVAWVTTPAPGASQIAYRIVVCTGAAQTTPPTPYVWDTGWVSSSAQSVIVGVALSNNTQYTAYGMVQETGGEYSGGGGSGTWSTTTWTESFAQPAQPLITATAGTDSGANDMPAVVLSVKTQDNYLSQEGADFETGIGTWAASTGTTLSQYVQSYNAYLASLNPSAWWRLDDPVGSATVTDYSGNGYTGTVNGGVTLGKPGPPIGSTSALFDGSTGYITTNLNTSYEALSIIAWVNIPTYPATSNPRIINNDHTGVDYNGYELFFSGRSSPTQLTGDLGNGTTTSTSVASSDPINGMGWTMVALTYDGNTITLYQNGSPVSSASFSGTITKGSNGATLGVGVYLLDYWPGYLAQTAVFSNALTAQQVSQLYNLAYYPASMKVDCAAGTVTVTWGTPIDVQAGNDYSALAEILAGTTGLTSYLALAWYNSSGTLISTSNGTAAATSTSAWTGFSVTATAPTGTHYVLPQIVFESAAAGDLMYVDAAGVFPNWGNPTGATAYDMLLLSYGRPTGWWKLADTVGSATAADSSGNGYTGTVNGGVTFGETGPIVGTPADTAALFDGSSGYIETTTSVPMDLVTGPLTFIAWVKLHSYPAAEGLIVGNYANVGVSVNSSGQLQAWLDGIATPTSTVMSTGSWHFISLVYTGAGSTTRTLYLDGVAIDSETDSTAIDATADLSIGAQEGFSGYSTYFPGDIAEVALFPSALTATQIAELYAARTAALPAWNDGGFVGTTSLVVLRDDGNYLRGASLANQVAIPSSQELTLYDHEAASNTSFTYTAQVFTTYNHTASAPGYSAPVTLNWTGSWEADVTNLSVTGGLIDPTGLSPTFAQITQWNPVQMEQSAAHVVLGQSYPNVIANAMGQTGFTAEFQTFAQTVYDDLEAILTSQKTIYVSMAYGKNYYVRFGPPPDNMSNMGMGSKVKDAKLQPSTAAGPYYITQATAVPQPRPAP